MPQGSATLALHFKHPLWMLGAHPQQATLLDKTNLLGTSVPEYPLPTYRSVTCRATSHEASDLCLLASVFGYGYNNLTNQKLLNHYNDFC